MNKKCVSIVAMSVLLGSALSASAATVCEDQVKMESFQKPYQYASKQFTEELLVGMHCDESFLKNPTNAWPMIGMFTGYFESFPEFISIAEHTFINIGKNEGVDWFLDAVSMCPTSECQEFIDLKPFGITDEQITRTREAERPDPRTSKIENPAELQMVWGYYYGSGKQDALESILTAYTQQLSDLSDMQLDLDDPEDERLLEPIIDQISLIEWTLLSSAASDPIVYNQIIASTNTAPAVTQLKRTLLDASREAQSLVEITAEVENRTSDK